MKKPAKGAALSTSQEDPATVQVAIAEGRGRPPMERATAQAIADAHEAAGHPTPAQVQAALDAPEAPETPAAPAAPETEA